MALMGIKTYEDLATLSGIDRYKLQRLVSGAQEPKLSDILAISRALQSAPEELWEGLAEVKESDAEIIQQPEDPAPAAAGETNGGTPAT